MNDTQTMSQSCREKKNHFPKDLILSWSKAFFSLSIEGLQAALILTAPSGWSKYRQQKTFNETQFNVSNSRDRPFSWPKDWCWWSCRYKTPRDLRWKGAKRDFIKLMKELDSKSSWVLWPSQNYWFSAFSLALSKCSQHQGSHSGGWGKYSLDSIRHCGAILFRKHLLLPFH